MKYIKIILTGLLIHSLHASENQPILLKSQVLHVIDGMPFGVDEFAIYDMIIVGHAIREMQNGKKDKNGQKIGKYEFKGKKYTLNELVEFEEKIKDKADLILFKELLNEVKDDFQRTTIKFIDKAKDPTTKEFMTQLIHESCELRGRKDSYLHSWASQSGTDFDAMRGDVKNLKDCNIFFTDLVNFLGDVIHSCPKGLKKYRELKKILDNKH